MAVGDFLAGLNLDPGTAAKLAAMTGGAPPGGAPPVPAPYGPPNDAPMGPPNDDGINAGPVTPAEAEHYNASPAERAGIARNNKAVELNVNPANPVLNPRTPGEQAQVEQEAEDKAPALRPPPDAEGDAEPGMMSSPGHYVGARWVPGSRSMTTQHGIDESKLAPGQKERSTATEYAQWASQDIEHAAAKEAQGDVAYAAAHAQAVEQHAAEQARIQNEKQAYTIREHEKLDTLAQAAQAQIDPEAAKGSSGAQLFAALAVGLGTFGSSITGGPNTALQIVNANIDRRISAQQSNINNAHKALSNEENLYKANLEAFGDKDRAALATKMQYLDQAKAQLDQVYAGAKSNRNDAQYHAMQEGILNKKAEYLDQFGVLTADRVATTGNEHYAPAHMEGGGASVGTKGKEELYVPSLHIYARTKEEAKELRANSARTQNTVRELERAQGIIAEAKQTSDPRKIAELQRELKGVAARAAVTATVKEGQGAMSEGDRLISESGLGLADINLGLMNRANPLSPSLDSDSRIIGKAMKAHQQEFGRMGAGQQRGREVYVRDPVTGKVEARQVLSGSSTPDRNKVDDLSDKIEKPKGVSKRAK